MNRASFLLFLPFFDGDPKLDIPLVFLWFPEPMNPLQFGGIRKNVFGGW